MKCELPSKSISIFPSSHGYITGLASKISAGAYPVAVLGSERIACPAAYRSGSSQFFGRSWFPPQNNFNMRIWALNGIKKSHDSIMKARIFSFIFFDHWLSLAIPLWLPCSYDIDLNTVFLMQDSTNFVAKLSSPIVNDNTWSEISAVDMLVKKLCKALCSWARYGSKENIFRNYVLHRCHKNHLV